MNALAKFASDHALAEPTNSQRVQFGPLQRAHYRVVAGLLDLLDETRSAP